MIGIGRFLAWPAWIGERPVSLTSCWFRADPFIASSAGRDSAGRDVTATRTLTVDITVASIHVVSRENNSNFNGIQCKRRLIGAIDRTTRPRSWWWISGDRAQNTHPSPSTRHLWSGWAALSSSAFTSQRISHGLLTQMQCWRRHISASSSWDGWGSLERAPESSGPSTPALWRASWPAASPPGLETAPLATAATLLEVSFPPSRISTPGGVQGKPGGLSKTPATRPTDCSLCCPQGDVPQHPIPH